MKSDDLVNQIGNCVGVLYRRALLQGNFADATVGPGGERHRFLPDAQASRRRGSVMDELSATQAIWSNVETSIQKRSFLWVAAVAKRTSAAITIAALS